MSQLSDQVEFRTKQELSSCLKMDIYPKRCQGLGVRESQSSSLPVGSDGDV